MRFLIAFLTIISAANATLVDYCFYLESNQSLTAKQVTRLKNQHLVVEHKSIKSLNKTERLNLMTEYFKDLCRAPLVHRRLVSEAKIETHLVAGPITLHPYIGNLDEGPRGHTTDWSVVAGAAGTSKNAPTVINIKSLNSGHGSSNLVLHEFAHVLDRFYHGYEIYNFDLSPSQAFQQLHLDTPWEDVYAYGQIPYHRNHPEEHFAELYSRWFMGDQFRLELIKNIPHVESFFDSLLK